MLGTEEGDGQDTLEIRAVEQPGGTEKSKRIRPLSGKIFHSAGVQNSAETVKEEGRRNGQNTK